LWNYISIINPFVCYGLLFTGFLHFSRAGIHGRLPRPWWLDRQQLWVSLLLMPLLDSTLIISSVKAEERLASAVVVRTTTALGESC
jgi:hypothetical protein